FAKEFVMYMPTLARFTARDPVPPNGEPVLLGRVPDALAGYAPSSPYEYANNDPLRYTDASGLQPSDSVCQKKPKCETVKAKRNKSNKCEEGYTPIETVTKGRINQVISECLKNCNKNG